MAWFDDNRVHLGLWASRIEQFAARYRDPNQYRRRVGRYVLWCVQHGHDPAEPDAQRVTSYLAVTRKLVEDRPMADRTQRAVRSCIDAWQDWLDTMPSNGQS